jgi:hypothetical protein
VKRDYFLPILFLANLFVVNGYFILSINHTSQIQLDFKTRKLKHMRRIFIRRKEIPRNIGTLTQVANTYINTTTNVFLFRHTNMISKNKKIKEIINSN